MSHKAKGARRERQARDILASAGYLVTKAGGSLGAFDLVALNPLGVRCVQVKANRREGLTEREQLIETAESLPSNATVEVWVVKDGMPREPFIYVLAKGRGPR